VLYRRLAALSEGEHRDVLLELAAAEERHARYWEEKLAELGVASQGVAAHRPAARTRLLTWLAGRLGVPTIVPFLERAEAAERGRYGGEPEAGPGIAADELVHAQLVAGLAPAWRSATSGSLRAGVFGVNDGLVSNLGLVVGVTGGGASSEVVMLAGLAGLVAGAGSMAAGEFISVKSQRELLEGERPPTGQDLLAVAEGPVAQFELLMRLRGLEPEEASAIAASQDPESAAAAAAEALARAQPDLAGLGSPGGAAASSFLAFAAGAAVPVLPFVVASGGAALWTAMALAAVALFAVGALLSLLTGRPLLLSGTRQLTIGALTAVGTYLVGRAVDIAIG
jgi:VIT1/CCC1 family predicted Fe2+/Mn2+ transporter